MSRCPAWAGLCENDMKCAECRFYPCKNSWRYKGSPPYKSNCFRCKYARAGSMEVICDLGKGRNEQ